MKIIIGLLLIISSFNVSALSTQYIMRVDGLVCPFCAFGIEKKLKAIDGLSQIDVDLDKGLVKVVGNEKVTLTDKQMTTLFQDSGFTFRSMKTKEVK